MASPVARAASPRSDRVTGRRRRWAPCALTGWRGTRGREGRGVRGATVVSRSGWERVRYLCCVACGQAAAAAGAAAAVCRSNETSRGKTRGTSNSFTPSFFFVEPGDPFFLSCPKGASDGAGAVGAVVPWAVRRLQYACVGEVVIIPQPRLYWGYFFLGSVQYLGNLHVSCSSPSGHSCRLWRGRREGVGPLLRMRACLAQVLHHATSGLRREFAISPLWLDLWTLSLARYAPKKLRR